MGWTWREWEVGEWDDSRLPLYMNLVGSTMQMEMLMSELNWFCKF